MSAYRQLAERDKYEDVKVNKPQSKPWLELAVRIALFVQGPIVAGRMHDMCTQAREGLCWSVGGVSVAVSLFTLIVTAG